MQSLVERGELDDMEEVGTWLGSAPRKEWVFLGHMAVKIAPVRQS